MRLSLNMPANSTPFESDCLFTWLVPDACLHYRSCIRHDRLFPTVASPFLFDLLRYTEDFLS
jgi:hypothetical protein